MSDIDLTTLDRPLGEYPDAVIGALVRAWKSGAVLQCSLGDGDDWDDASCPSFRMGYFYRLAPEPMRPATPPWDVLPEWVQAVAFDKSGEDFIYEVVPILGDTDWLYTEGRCRSIAFLRYDRGNMPWNESLVLRPEGV